MKILCVPKKTISGPQKRVFEKHGYLIVEVDDPSLVKIFTGSDFINPEKVSAAAIAAIRKADFSTSNSEFVKRMDEIMNPKVESKT